MNIKVLFLSILTLAINICYSQNKDSTNNCDENLIYKLVNLRIKTIEEKDTNKYCLDIRVSNFNTLNPKNGIYYRYCASISTWNNEKIQSKYSSFNSVGSCRYNCSIGMPIFNKYKTKCVIPISISNSEWNLASGRAYYYKKRFGKWRMVRSSMTWVS